MGRSRLLSSSSSASDDEKKEFILVEDVTSPSHPKEQKQLAEALKGIATQLSIKGSTAADIAEILDVTPVQVEHFLQTQLSEESAKEYEKAQLASLSVRQPHFDEVSQLLLPSVEAGGALEFEVLDKRQKLLA